MAPDRDAHRSRRRRKGCVQPAALRKGQGHSWAGAVEPGARRAIGIPVDELDEPGLVGKRRWEDLAATAFENETGLRAVDAHLLHLGVSEVFRQWAERRDRAEDATPELLGLLGRPGRRGQALVLANHATHQLVDPRLVFGPQAGAIAARELGCQLGLDHGADTSLGGRRADRYYGHVDLLPVTVRTPRKSRPRYWRSGPRFHPPYQARPRPPRGACRRPRRRMQPPLSRAPRRSDIRKRRPESPPPAQP